MRKGFLWLTVATAPAMWLAAQGCSGETVNVIDSGVDGTTSMGDSGGGMDVEMPDTAMGDGSVLDAPADVAPDSPPPGLTYLCVDGGTVSDCSQCMGRPRPCVNCFIDGGGLYAACVTLQTSCFPPNNSPYQRCPCADAGSCPQDFQVCHDVGLGLACRTCGETNTLNDTCKGGGMCRADGGCN